MSSTMGETTSSPWGTYMEWSGVMKSFCTSITSSVFIVSLFVSIWFDEILVTQVVQV